MHETELALTTSPTLTATTTSPRAPRGRTSRTTCGRAAIHQGPPRNLATAATAVSANFAACLGPAVRNPPKSEPPFQKTAEKPQLPMRSGVEFCRTSPEVPHALPHDAGRQELPPLTTSTGRPPHRPPR